MEEGGKVEEGVEHLAEDTRRTSRDPHLSAEIARAGDLKRPRRARPPLRARSGPIPPAKRRQDTPPLLSAWNLLLPGSRAAER